MHEMAALELPPSEFEMSLADIRRTPWVPVWAFDEVVTVLSRVFNVRGDKRTAFGARITHLHRLGWPSATSPGQGKARRYTAEDIWRLSYTLELGRIGLPPAAAIHVARAALGVLNAARQSRAAVTLYTPLLADPLMRGGFARSGVLLDMRSLVLAMEPELAREPESASPSAAGSDAQVIEPHAPPGPLLVRERYDIPPIHWPVGVDSLPMSIRAANVLARSGIRTLGDLHGVSERQFRQIPGAGNGTINSIRFAVRQIVHGPTPTKDEQ